MLAIMEYTDRLFLEIVVPAGIDIDKFLGIAIYQREPGALHLDHQPVTFFKGMSDIRDGETDGLYFPRPEGYGLFKALAEAAPHHFPTHQHLVAAHGNGLRRFTTAGRGFITIG